MTSARSPGWPIPSRSRQKSGRRQAGLDVLQAVVPAVAAALLEPDAARRQVEVVMHDQCLVGGDLVETGQRGDRLPGQVHVGHRLQQPQFTDPGDPAEELALRQQRCLQAARAGR
jgi:hypothetical protein